jgi:hypothetical protein
MHIENIIIGELDIHLYHLLAHNIDDWNDIEKEKTLYTKERFLPKYLWI